MTPCDLCLDLCRELDQLARLPLDKRPADYGRQRAELWRRIAALRRITDPIGPFVQVPLFEVAA